MLVLLLLLVALPSTEVCQASSLESLYTQARQVRTMGGHEAARPLYEELFTRNNEKDVTAATRIARHPDSMQRHSRLGIGGALDERQSFIRQLQSFHFTPTAIADLIFPSSHQNDHANFKQAEKAKASSAPLYLQPLRAGSPVPLQLPTCPISACIQLFLLAVCLPIEICQEYLGHDMVELMETLGVAFLDDDGWIIPYCHIMPVTVLGCSRNSPSRDQTLYFATDLHPNVLSTTTVGTAQEGTVMYIGPDSLALVDHWTARRQTAPTKATMTSNGNLKERIVDFGTGSGIQALSLASLYSPDKVHVTCVDINPRALRVARLNFEWNEIIQPEPTLLLGDITHPAGERFETTKDPKQAYTCTSWEELLGRPTTILANPPFLPVPVQDPIISKRYGWFSSGGASGDVILRRIVELASKTLDNSSTSGGGTLAIVSEFMNPQTVFSDRLKDWWGEGKDTTTAAAQAILFSNEPAMDAETYAQRRADTALEFERWKQHLEQEKITHISPGLLFVQKMKGSSAIATSSSSDDSVRLQFSQYLLPKTVHGSIWTPTNRMAREYTQNVLESVCWSTQQD